MSFMDLVELQKDLRRIPVVELETPTVVHSSIFFFSSLLLLKRYFSKTKISFIVYLTASGCDSYFLLFIYFSFVLDFCVFMWTSTLFLCTPISQHFYFDLVLSNIFSFLFAYSIHCTYLHI